MKNIYKAMEAIETLVGGDFGMEMEWLASDKEGKVDERLRTAAEIITKIYCIAHAENSKGCTHPEWEKIKYEINEKNRL